MIDKSFYHAYPKYEGKTFKWLPMDTQELYQYNLKNNKQKLQQIGWIDKEISYQFNSNGFRTDEFEDCDCAVFLGCSFTIGIGIPYENTWPHLVSKELGLKCFNLGQGNGSWDTSFRIGSYWIEKLNPKYVIAMGPPSTRYEIMPHGTISIHQEENFKNTLLSDLFMFDRNYELNKQKNIIALKSFCKNTLIMEYDSEWFNVNWVDMARDLAHPGIKTNALLKNKVLDLIKKY